MSAKVAGNLVKIDPTGVFATDAGVAAADILRFGAYTGQVATGCFFADGATDGVAEEFNSRSAHYARDDIGSLQVAFANFYGEHESAPGASMAVQAAVEYPVGTVSRITFAGGNTQTTADGAMGAISDAVAVTIPRGALFYIRAYLVNASGVPYIFYNEAHPFSQAEFGAVGALTNKVMSGSITPVSGFVVPPALIVARTTRPSFAIFADSIGFGVGDSFDDLSGEKGLRRAFAAHYGYTASAISGVTLGVFVSGSNSAKRRAAISPYVTHVVQQMATNDLGTSGTAADLLTSLTTFLGLSGVSGKKVLQVTAVPRSTSIDGWITTANQTTVNNTERIAFNRRVRAGVAGLAGYFDACRAFEDVRDAGKWRIDLGGLTADGIHPAAAMYRAVLEERGVFAQALPFLIVG